MPGSNICISGARPRPLLVPYAVYYKPFVSIRLSKVLTIFVVNGLLGSEVKTDCPVLEFDWSKGRKAGSIIG